MRLSPPRSDHHRAAPGRPGQHPEAADSGRDVERELPDGGGLRLQPQLHGQSALPEEVRRGREEELDAKTAEAERGPRELLQQPRLPTQSERGRDRRVGGGAGPGAGAADGLH